MKSIVNSNLKCSTFQTSVCSMATVLRKIWKICMGQNQTWNPSCSNPPIRKLDPTVTWLWTAGIISMASLCSKLIAKFKTPYPLLLKRWKLIMKMVATSKLEKWDGQNKARCIVTILCFDLCVEITICGRTSSWRTCKVGTQFLRSNINLDRYKFARVMM